MCDKIKLEVEKESYRFNDKDYHGVLFVHPYDVEESYKILKGLGAVKLEYQNGEITFPSGATMLVKTLESCRSNPAHDYAGYELTTVMINFDCFGKYDSESNYKSITYSPAEFIGYMTTRLRSQSKHHSHMVLF